MQFAAFILVFPTFIVDRSSAGLSIESSDPDRSRLVETSIDILESCYANQIGTVGLAGASAGSIIEAISLRDTVIPVALIDETSRLANHDPVDGASRYKLQVFVVTVTDRSILAKTLIQIKNSKWWNHMASFILIASPETGNGCSNAYEILWVAWKMDLLNSKFLCLDRTRERLIYTFNPYTSKAPVPWQQENTYKGINDHVWTLYVRVYREDASRCNALDFDKAVDLGGYEIRGSLARDVATNKSGGPEAKPSILSDVHGIVSQLIFSSLNATWKLLMHPLSEGPPQDKKGNPLGWAAEVINGSSDMGLNLTFHHIWTKYETTVTVYHSTLVVMTQYPGYKSQLDKLISVLDKSSRYSVFVVLLITLLFFKCYVRQSSIPAILNIVLMICNAAISMIPKKLAPRIYLSSVFILVVTIQGIYQGKFSSLLTKPERLPLVDSIDDLARSDHTIYGLNYGRSFFTQSALEGRYFQIRDYNCTKYVLRDSKIACAYEKLFMIDEAEKFKLHLSGKPMGPLCGMYLVRPDWPLKDRVNVIYKRAFEGDILKPLYTREVHNIINKLESYAKKGQEQAFKPITLSQLTFAFVILAIGLVCATVTFIVEVAIYDTPIANRRSRVRRRMAIIRTH